MFVLAKHLEARALSLGRNMPPLVISPEKNDKFSSEISSHQQILRKNSKFLNFNQENNGNADETVFESFLGDENAFYQTNYRKKTSFLNTNLTKDPLGSAHLLNNIEVSDKMELVECIQEFKSYSPIKFVYTFLLNIPYKVYFLRI